MRMNQASSIISSWRETLYRNPDGKMTARTLVAIRKYQKSRNIKTTGALDETTRSAMIDDIARSL